MYFILFIKEASFSTFQFHHFNPKIYIPLYQLLTGLNFTLSKRQTLRSDVIITKSFNTGLSGARIASSEQQHAVRVWFYNA